MKPTNGIQDNLEGGGHAPAARKDFNEDFPLRGFVLCDCCGNAMTVAWSKGKYRHYAYYRCETRGCEAKSKSVPRAKMEEGFAEILKGLQPAKKLFALAKAMLRDAWDMRLAAARNEKDALRSQLRDVERQISSLLDRVVDANSASVVNAYEARIEQLEREKIVLNERLEKTVPPKGRLEDCIEHTLGFLANPWNIYKNGDFAMRQLVLRLAFSKPLRYSQNDMYGTPEFSFPFKYLAGILGEKSEMVRRQDGTIPGIDAPNTLRAKANGENLSVTETEHMIGKAYSDLRMLKVDVIGVRIASHSPTLRPGSKGRLCDGRFFDYSAT